MKIFPAIVLSGCIALSTLVSCRAIVSVMNDDKVIAQVGKHRLTQSDVRPFIPEGTSPDDSVRIVMRYINVWASEQIFADEAEKRLSKEEKDVTEELEEYRMALLRYRYEQRYINERLDTVITEEEIEDYYNAHAESFIAEVPVVKARFMRISKDSPNLSLIRKKMSSEKTEDLIEADSIAYSSADRYTDYGEKWIDMVELAKDFDTDYGSLLSSMRNSFIETTDAYGKVNVAYISEFVKAGDVLPMEYCENEIREILIGTRKHKLVTDLERDLMEDARDKGKLVIY